MGAPVDMIHGGHGLGVGPYDYDTAGSGMTASKSGVVDWINAITGAVDTVVGVVGGKPKPPIVIQPPVRPVQQGSIFGMSPMTLLMIGGVVVVGTVLMNRKRR
jgi:hypothetical protein